MDLTEIKSILPDDEVGCEMFECIQSLPSRFWEDALDLFCCADDREMWNMKTVDKSWSYFLEDIMQLMSVDEKIEYGFTTIIPFNVERRAVIIVDKLISEKGIVGISVKDINNEVNFWMDSIKEELLDNVYNCFEERNIKIE